MTINDDPNYVGVIHGGIDGGTGYNVMINAVNNPYNSFMCLNRFMTRMVNLSKVLT